MGWSFRESIKILPGVRLNFSRKGVSASLGTKGLHLGVGGGRAPRVTGGIGPLHYYQSVGGSGKRREPRYRAPSRTRLLVGATFSICLLLGWLWVPPHWVTSHLQAAAPQLFPASWAAGFVAEPADHPAEQPSAHRSAATPAEHRHHPKNEAATHTVDQRHEAGR